MAWTKEQMQCIKPVNGIHNMLVSAGAGAGKTATLVEKIILSITSNNHDVGIDEILCMTFSREAAREMRERIINAVENMIHKYPHDVWLKKQLELVETASIMTIDSFCLRLIKEHISNVDIDPAFRIADSAELTMLWNKTMDMFLEKKYEEADPAFISFADSYSTGKHDQVIRDSIQEVYKMAQSNPFPLVWLDGCRDKLKSNDVDQAAWLLFLMQDIRKQLLSLEANLHSGVSVCLEPEGPYNYEKTLQRDLLQVQGLLSCCNSFDSLSPQIAGITFARMSSSRDRKINPAKKEYVMSIRNGAKKVLQELYKKYNMSSAELKKANEETRPHLLMLLQLTEEFIKQYSQVKQEKAIMDFSDIEHVALSLLAYPDSEQYTALADSVSSNFKQIYIDEYQDVNMLQETIINSVSGMRFGKPNVFMVGDVKQSIYKFRLARPELFMEKYTNYLDNDMASNQKVELHKNFRSRKEILDTINFFFSQLMTQELGINYDEKAALNYGAAYPKGVEARKTTLMLIDTKFIPDMDEEISSRQLEAIQIADTIKGIVGKEAVFDKLSGGYRAASYKDIVVLTRTFAGWADDIRAILDDQHIPSYTDKREGFFDTVEVQAVLSVLQAADNPMQDIAITAAMMRVWSFTVEEMAELTITFKRQSGNIGGMYSYILFYKDNGCNCILKEKVSAFLDFLKKIDAECKDLSIYDLLNMIYVETGYYAKVSSLPTGEVKKANLEMLLMEAEKFTTTSNASGGIFQFVRYVEAVQKFETEAPASVYADRDAVRITTIHKSKGLEFPVVIIAGIGKRFNQQDTRKPILVHQDLGVVSDFINPTDRTKKLTMAKKAVARKMKIEMLEEELRILYVAMTRAKERLILVGTVKGMNEKMGQYVSLSSRKIIKLPYMELTRVSSHLEWIFMAMVRHEIFTPFMALSGLQSDYSNPIYKLNANLEITQIDVRALLQLHIGPATTVGITKEIIVHALESRRNFLSNLPYHHQDAAELKPKVSPEDLFINKSTGNQYSDYVREPFLPLFMKHQDKSITGADKGNLYHKLLQVLDFRNCTSSNGVIEEIKKNWDRIVTNELNFSFININSIVNLFQSDIGKRMILASQRGFLSKEIYYMELIPAQLVNPAIIDETSVIIQGIIDVYFKEDNDKYVLVDYKSEFVEAGNETLAAKKYYGQMERYRSAMIKNEKKVEEVYLIFLQTGVAIPL